MVQAEEAVFMATAALTTIFVFFLAGRIQRDQVRRKAG